MWHNIIKGVDIVSNNDNIYLENGYKNRDDYLESLSDDYGVPLETVYILAETLGESEEFDGLISALEDAEGMIYDE